MQYRAFSYPSWSRSFWVTSLAVALVAAFFVIWGTTAHAQQPGQRPDLRITKASFNGRDLHVEYVNATGVGYPARRYEVGFQWYDAAGRPVGERHWLSQPEVERGGVAILDTKYRTDLTYRRSGSNYNRRLLDFILQRPNTAEELRVTVDDGDRISETDETNNVARLKIPLPDLQITGAKFLSPNRLELSYRNANPSPIPLPFRIGFTWAEEGGAYASATRWINVLEPAAGETKTEVLSRTDASYITTSGRQAGDRLDWYFERRPGNATRMKITIDDAGEVREVNEHDNVVTARPFLPDLVVRDAKLTDGQLTFTYGNDDEGTIRDTASRVLIQWVDATGKPIGGPRWIRFAQMDPKQTFAVNADRFDVEYAISGTNRTTRQRLSTYLRERPAGATQLTMTIDDERRILEANEQNNSATVTFATALQPDLTLEQFTVTNERPSFTYRNSGGPTLADQRILIALEWLDARGAALPLRLESDLGALTAGEFRSFVPGATLRKWRVTDGRRDGDGDTVFFLAFQEPARGATALRITIDPANVIPERDEQNNTLIVPINRVDFSIRESRFDGTELSFTYASSGSDPAVRPPLSLWFEWADASGARVGDLAWSDVAFLLPGTSRAFRSGNERIVVGATNGSSRVFPMREFLTKPPTGARALRVFVDGPNRYDEPDETDNVVLLPIPDPSRPDFAITGATTLTADQLIVVVQNSGTGPAPESLSYWFEWVNAAGGRVGPLFWHDARGAIAAGDEVRLDVTTAPLRRERPRDAFSDPATFADLMTVAPESATHLRVRVDGSNTHPESDEGNNVLLLPKPAKPQPDLTVENAVLTMDGFSVVFVNRGIGVASEVPWSLVWLDASESAIGTPFVGRWEALASHGQRNMQIGARPIVPGSAVAYIAQSPASAVKLRITVDPDNVIVESDEGNNAALLAKPVGPLPDLAFARVTVKVEAPSPKIEYVGANRGTADVERVTLGLQWLDANGNATGPAHPPYVVFGRLRAGGTSTTWMLPFSDSGQPVSRALGRYLLLPPSDATHLRLMLDPENVTPESDEANNTAIVERPASVPLADLTITKTKLAEDSFALTYQNIGPVYAGYFMTLSTWFEWVNANGARIGDLVWHDGESLDPRYATHLSAATVVSSAARAKFPLREFLAAPPSGATHLKVTVDGPNALLEANETNNTALIPRPAVPLPDLAFTNIFLVPPQRERLVIGFENRGKTTAPEFQWKLAWVNAAGQRLGTPYEGVGLALKPNWRFGAGSDVNELDPKGKPMPRGKWLRQPKPEGAVKLEIIIDPENVVAESDETNNRQTFAEWIPPKPVEPEKESKSDLSLRDARLADGKLRATIVNIGKGPAERVMWQFRWLGEKDSALATSDLEAAVGTLKPGASYPVELSYANARPVGIFRFLQDMPDGSTALDITVDPKNAIAESDEGNNTTRIALPGADLAFGVPVVRGDAFIIPVVNHGSTASVPTDLWLQWHGKGKWLPGSGAVDVPAVNGGSTVEVKVPLNRSFGPDGKLLMDIPPSAERLRLFVDGLRKVPERNEQNNLLMVDRAVFPAAAETEKPGKPDLVPEGLKVGPANPTEGAMLDFSAVVRNKGTGKAGASVAWFIVDFDRDDEPDVSPEPDDVKPLAPNATQAIMWEDAVEAQTGTHAVEFCVDVEEVVDESNEDNNCVSYMFTMGSGAAAPARSVASPFRSILGAILSGLATPIVAGERPY